MLWQFSPSFSLAMFVNTCSVKMFNQTFSPLIILSVLVFAAPNIFADISFVLAVAYDIDQSFPTCI